MSGIDEGRVTARQRSRKAYFYVRQATVRPRFDPGERVGREVELRRRAAALGWSAGQVEVIDQDLGRSGATALDRGGFERLLSEVLVGKVGLVMALDVSRFTRNASDWQQLLEICALSETLILVEDGLFAPAAVDGEVHHARI